MIAILGCTGQLGQAFLRRLGEKAVGLGRGRLDLGRPETIHATLQSLQAETVINCAAYNAVDQAEADPVAPFAVNAWGVRALADVCHSLGPVLIHFSTNYVFGLDQQRRTPYKETDLPGPVNLYGASKLAGEYLVRASCPRHFVIRTAGLFGHGGSRRNFVELMQHLAATGQTIRVVEDQTCSPTFTEDLVDATLRLLQTKAYGLYHLTSAGVCTWHEFAQTIFSMTNVQADLQAVSSEAFGAAARRPAYSVMANDGYMRLGLPPIRDWRDGLQAYLKK